MNKQDNINFDEMLLHVPMCSHPDIKNLLLINAQTLEKEALKHYNVQADTIDKEEDISAVESNKYDVVISRADISAFELERVLNDKGLASVESKSYWEDFGMLREELFELSQKFNICMPYKVEGYVTLQMKGNIFVSKKYHPTADMILQKIDLLDGLVYYDSDNHIASFTLPKAINKELMPIMKK